jgi:hypothetical protein
VVWPWTLALEEKRGDHEPRVFTSARPISSLAGIQLAALGSHSLLTQYRFALSAITPYMPSSIRQAQADPSVGEMWRDA